MLMMLRKYLSCITDCIILNVSADKGNKNKLFSLLVSNVPCTDMNGIYVAKTLKTQRII